MLCLLCADIVSVVTGDVNNPDEISLDDDDVAMESGNPKDETPLGTCITHTHTHTHTHTPRTHTHAHTDAGVGGWVIDTAGGRNRTRLSLPPPSNTPQSHDQSHDSPPVSHDHPGGGEEPSQDQPKIKRRNIALYSLPAQSDEEDN